MIDYGCCRLGRGVGPGRSACPGKSAYPGMRAINAFLIRERADTGEAAEEALEVGAIPIF